MTDLRDWLPRAVDAIGAWESTFGDFEPHPSMTVTDDVLRSAFDGLVERLGDNYPYGHPRYVGQILKPPHPAATLGYVTAMLINPNNHALDGGPATAALEKEVVVKLASPTLLIPHSASELFPGVHLASAFAVVGHVAVAPDHLLAVPHALGLAQRGAQDALGPGRGLALQFDCSGEGARPSRRHGRLVECLDLRGSQRLHREQPRLLARGRADSPPGKARNRERDERDHEQPVHEVPPGAVTPTGPPGGEHDSNDAGGALHLGAQG